MTGDNFPEKGQKDVNTMLFGFFSGKVIHRQQIRTVPEEGVPTNIKTAGDEWWISALGLCPETEMKIYKFSVLHKS